MQFGQVLSISAKSHANDVELEQLLSLESEQNLELKINSTLKLYEKLGVRDYCEQKMKDHYNQAMNSLNCIENGNSLEKLINLSDYLFNREH